MVRWVAKFNEDDDSMGEEIKVGYNGALEGFEIVLSNEEPSGILPAMSTDEAMEVIDDYFGFFDTFDWLDTEDLG